MSTSDFIFDNSLSFDEKALRVFELQRNNNPVYHRFCNALGILEPLSGNEIPLLPIQAFKETKVLTTAEHSTFNIQHLEFRSSGTSGMERSKHIISNPEIYQKSIVQGMQHFYDLDDYVIWAYTPGYNQNPNSSLIWMLNTLIEREKSGLSKFLELGKGLAESELEKVQNSGKRLILFGAAFGLMDLLESYRVQLPEDAVILETGGMKTHRREITKEELHLQLAEGFGLSQSQIHSEYGMTELLSQAYAQGSLWFEGVPWMKVSIRDPKAPMQEVDHGEEGLIGVMDLANLYSCSFILTGDKGVQREDGKFQVLGRWNPKNLRGCNFLIDRD
ncbi:LuxE/PaaK family acyltransferase [Gracilimonas halophila]|uniref:Acyl-protein synthetase LuxE domain-containing protein n=1 Tax=Gracilimonas halophila TaxID=1834464 RepID=A0ABW5JMS3_9BACT